MSVVSSPSFSGCNSSYHHPHGGTAAVLTTLGDSMQEERTRSFTGSVEWDALENVIKATTGSSHTSPQPTTQQLGSYGLLAVADEIVSSSGGGGNGGSGGPTSGVKTPTGTLNGGGIAATAAAIAKEYYGSQEYELERQKFEVDVPDGGGSSSNGRQPWSSGAAGYANMNWDPATMMGRFGGSGGLVSSLSSSSSTSTLHQVSPSTSNHSISKGNPMFPIHPNNFNDNPDDSCVWSMFPPEIITGRYTAPQFHSSGPWGVVAKATQLGGAPGQPPRAVAIKRLNTMKNPVLTLRALRELRILSRLRTHTNIIDLLDVRFDKIWNLYLVQPLMESDLRRMIVELNINRQLLNSSHVKRIIYQTLRGLKYIHSAKVIHRDLKPENLLINYRYGAYQVKICDFGLARVDAFEPYSDAERDKCLTKEIATMWYAAPELVMPHVWTYTRAVDIWSLGCILGELLGNLPIFMGKFDRNGATRQFEAIVGVLGTPHQDEIRGIMSNKNIDRDTQAFLLTLPPRDHVTWHYRFPHADSEALVLLNEMLQYRPAARPRAEQLLAKSDFLSTYHQPQSEPTCVIPFTANDMQVDGLQHNLNEWEALMMELRREVDGFHGGFGLDVGSSGIANGNGGMYYEPAAYYKNCGARVPAQKQFYNGGNNNSNNLLTNATNYNNNNPIFGTNNGTRNNNGYYPSNNNNYANPPSPTGNASGAATSNGNGNRSASGYFPNGNYANPLSSTSFGSGGAANGNCGEFSSGSSGKSSKSNSPRL